VSAHGDQSVHDDQQKAPSEIQFPGATGRYFASKYPLTTPNKYPMNFVKQPIGVNLSEGVSVRGLAKPDRARKWPIHYDSVEPLAIVTDIATISVTLTLRGRLAWAHDFDPDRSIGATFQTLPGASFVVNGAAQARDSALTTASAEMKWINGWSAAATFEGEFSSVTSSYAGKGVVRYAW
jgi:hypothetical protein